MISKKGQLGGGIVVTMIIVSILIGSILYFFYAYKFHVKLQTREQYTWNKVQEIPLDLLSMDIGKESFVSSVNRVYYDIESVDYLDDVGKIVDEQLFHLTGRPSNMGYVISVQTKKGSITLSESPFIPAKYCRCLPIIGTTGPPFFSLYQCCDECPKAGRPCEKQYPWGPGPALELCYDIGSIAYTAYYPFPLTFNGTDDLTASVFYYVMEYK